MVSQSLSLPISLSSLRLFSIWVPAGSCYALISTLFIPLPIIIPGPENSNPSQCSLLSPSHFDSTLSFHTPLKKERQAISSLTSQWESIRLPLPFLNLAHATSILHNIPTLIGRWINYLSGSIPPPLSSFLSDTLLLFLWSFFFISSFIHAGNLPWSSSLFVTIPLLERNKLPALKVIRLGSVSFPLLCTL